MAHHAGEDFNVPAEYGAKFRAIARLLWQAHGEPGRNPPNGAGTELAAKMGVRL